MGNISLERKITSWRYSPVCVRLFSTVCSTVPRLQEQQYSYENHTDTLYHVPSILMIYLLNVDHRVALCRYGSDRIWRVRLRRRRLLLRSAMSVVGRRYPGISAGDRQLAVPVVRGEMCPRIGNEEGRRGCGGRVTLCTELLRVFGFGKNFGWNSGIVGRYWLRDTSVRARRLIDAEFNMKNVWNQRLMFGRLSAFGSWPHHDQKGVDSTL